MTDTEYMLDELDNEIDYLEIMLEDRIKDLRFANTIAKMDSNQISRAPVSDSLGKIETETCRLETEVERRVKDIRAALKKAYKAAAKESTDDS